MSAPLLCVLYCYEVIEKPWMIILTHRKLFLLLWLKLVKRFRYLDGFPALSNFWDFSKHIGEISRVFPFYSTTTGIKSIWSDDNRHKFDGDSGCWVLIQRLIGGDRWWLETRVELLEGDGGIMFWERSFVSSVASAFCFER